MPKNAMVTTDIGNICSVSNSYLRFEQPRSLLRGDELRQLRLRLSRRRSAPRSRAPDRPAVAYVGDGAWGMSLQETLTCVRENIPAIAVVFNNGQWGAEKKNQIDFYADRYRRHQPEEPELRRDRQGDGRRGHQGRPARTRSATRSSTAIASNKPTVLELMVTQELGDPFRRDALKKPVRAAREVQAYTVA